MPPDLNPLVEFVLANALIMQLIGLADKNIKGAFDVGDELCRFNSYSTLSVLFLKW